MSRTPLTLLRRCSTAPDVPWSPRKLFLATAVLFATCPWARAQETSAVQVRGIHDQFALALAEDSRQAVWIGTEDQGVWRLDEAQGRPRWTQYARPDGLGDESIHALACDKQGRIWAGHLSHGVSVFNGQRWHNYPVGEGPIGERVFSIKVCPTDGNVWVATNCGLSRYSVASNTWSHFTRENGLPENGVYRLAFAPNGDIVAGTDSHGLALASAARGYRDWRTVSGPQLLPNDLINDVLVTRSGIIYAATGSGLARSEDGASTWSVLRGRDAGAKAIAYLQYGQRGRASIQPGKARLQDAADGTGRVRSQASEDGEATSPTPSQLPSISAPPLREDYITCLAQDGDGRLWIGYRRDGYEARDAGTLRVLSPDNPEEDASKPAAGAGDDYVRSILPRSTGSAPLIGFYGRGTATARDFLQHTPLPPVPAPDAPALPSPVGGPFQNELASLLHRLEKVRPAPGSYAPLIAALEDDWSTQGEWLGRYGRYQAVLGAMLSPNDYVWGAGEVPVQYRVRIGPHALPDDSLRYWIHSLYTRTPESLEMPALYYHSRAARGWDKGGGPRRQSEWDDHGEEYPMSLDGPHVYASLRVPAGWFVLSLYDFNKDGHIGSNRWRDYRLSVRPRPSWLPLGDIDGFSSWPEAAQGRIHDFRGGVWKRFLVRGPQDLTVEVNRNFSFNTILAGLFLDRLEARPAPYFGSVQAWRSGQASREQERKRLLAELGNPALATRRHARFSPGRDAAETARRLWQAVQEVQVLDPQWHEQNGRLYYLALLRWCRRAQAAKALTVPVSSTSQASSARVARAEQAHWERACLEACLYQLRMYDEWEETLHASGERTPRDIELALRWDGALDNQGTGYEVVTKYLQDAAADTKTKSGTP